MHTANHHSAKNDIIQKPFSKIAYIIALTWRTLSSINSAPVSSFMARVPPIWSKWAWLMRIFLNVRRLIPDLVDRIHQHIQAFRNGCINKEQSVPCIYKITSCPGLPCHIPCTGSYLKRLNSQDPGPVSQSGHRILDCRSTTKRHNKTLLYLNLFPFW